MMNVERWHQFTLAEQMGHIGSEIGRAKVWEDKKENKERNNSLIRALELIDLTIADQKHRYRLKEICRFRDLVACKFIDSTEYKVTLAELDQYCLEFALITHKDK